MSASITDPIAFTPNRATLEAALDELDAIGTSGGGAVEPERRRRALATYERFTSEPIAKARGRRHDYRNLAYDDLIWTSGRTRMSAPRKPAMAEAPASDAPALAVENAGGLVHAGSIYLQATANNADPRVTLMSLADAKRDRAARVVPVLGRIAPADDPFVALATAFQNCGALVDIPEGVVLDAPLQLIFTSKPGETHAVFPQIVVRLGAGARATIVERHVGTSETFVCGTVEVELAERATCAYVVAQQADDGARIFFRRSAVCAERSHMSWHAAEFGGALVRSRIDADLAEEHASVAIDAFFFARGFDHADLGVVVEHGAEHTTSRTVIRSAATDRGFGEVNGTIRIAEEARRADASLRSDALVLSRDAHVDATPALEIATNDVTAYHAATIGSLDDETLFYIQQRGIARGTAQRMIALAFFEPAIAGFPSDALRDEVRTVLDAAIDEGVAATFDQ